MGRGRDGERGQAASEYVALLALVAVVFLGLVGLTSGGVAGHVLAGLQRGLCTVAPGPCPREVVPRADLAPCLLERSIREERAGETIAVVRLGSSGTLTATRASDGRVTVTLADGSTVGVEIGVGARLLVGGESGAESKAGAGLTWGSGRSWTFADAEGARRFVERYGDKATIRGKLLDGVRSRCSLLCDALGWRPHPRLPPPDEVHEEGGATGTLTASLGLGGRTSTAGGEAAAVLGRRRARDGETTWYVRLGGAASAKLRLPAGALAGGEGGRAVLSYRLDRAGRPLALGVHLAGEESASAALAGDGKRARASSGGGRGNVVELEAGLDLTEPANRAVAAELLDAVTGDLASAPERASALAALIARDGQIDVRRYALRTSATQFGASVSLGISLGGSFERTTKGLRLVEAQTRLPGLPFLPRDDCRAS